MNSSLFERKRRGGRRRKLVQGRVHYFVLVAYWFGGFYLSFIGMRRGGEGLGGQVMWWV